MVTENDPGVGAWKVPKFYGLDMNRPPVSDKYGTQRVKWAMAAVQRELIRQGFLKPAPGAVLGGPGPATDKAIKAFQTAAGLPATGKVNSKTAGRLFFQHIAWWQIMLPIPDNLLLGMIRLESAFDPGAEGYIDSRDRGMCQFNRFYHPDITDEIAFGDPPHCIAKTADMLATAHAKLGRWDAAVASHNNPSKARTWAATGRAPDEQIAAYVRLVREAAARPL